MRLFIAMAFALVLSSCSRKMHVAKTVSEAESQTRVMLMEIQKAKTGKPDLVSPRTLENGELKLVTSRDWTSGFFPGILWYLHEFTGRADWKDYARRFTADIEKEKTNAGTHDMGFKIYCSFGQAYRLTGEAHDVEVIVQAAKTLSTRFNPVIGCIRSWDHHRDVWQFPVIIDNMMNLELLFAATKLTGDSSYYRIAVAHANTTMKNHFRADFSTYHVIDYDTLTGEVLKRNTHQGFSHESAWSRGQAWALYGYTMCYRETRNPAYLALAEKAADYILNHPNLPKDLVPYWDFNAPAIPNEPRDASAAAIMASALYELGTFSASKNYRNTADELVRNLTKDYRSEIGGNKGFILLHSTGSKAGNSEIDVPLIYADYYYMEALMRKKNLQEKGTIR